MDWTSLPLLPYGQDVYWVDKHFRNFWEYRKYMTMDWFDTIFIYLLFAYDTTSTSKFQKNVWNHGADWLMLPELIPVSVVWSSLENSYSLWRGCSSIRSLPHHLLGFPNNLPVPIYTPRVEWGTVRVRCLSQEHSTMFPAKTQIWTARVH